VALDREKILQSAQKLIEKRRFDRALEEYQKLVQDDPNDARTLLKLGDLQVRMQLSADAMQTYDRVAQVYETQGFAVKALAVYKQIREHIQKRSPELADRFSHITPRLARIYAQLGLKSDAIQAFDEVASNLLRMGKRREAIDTFREMINLDSTNPLSYVRLAEAYCQLEEIASGQEAFSVAVDLLQRAGRDDDALRVIDRALHFANEPTLARLAAEILLRRATRADGLLALSKLQISFQADPKDLTVLGMLAQAFTLIEQPEKAVEVYKQMALIAREKGDQALFLQLVEYLIQVAPQDDQVRAMQLLLQQPQTPAPPSLESEPAVIELRDDDLVDDADLARLDRRPSDSAEPVDADYEMGDHADFDAASYAEKALFDAESFSRLKLPHKAIEPLRFALELDPANLTVRYKLREVLAEVGDFAAMRAESLQIAEVLADSGYLNEAVPFLSEVLAEEPRNTRAIRLYTSIYGQPPVPARPSPTLGLFSEPLPRFDDEDGQLMPPNSSFPGAQQLGEVDDPFAELREPHYQAGLPSFAIEEPFEDDRVEVENAAASSPPSTNQSNESGFGLEEVLDEAEFFAARGLYDDARGILEDQLARSPNHPLLLEKLREVLQASAGVSPSEDGAEQSHVIPSQYPPEDDDEFSSTLSALESLEVASAPFKAANSEVDVDQVFAKFKEGVRSQVEESDSATHYDLGVAYKEMGLTVDAIKELEIAARDPARECMCFAMIGLVHLEQNELDAAEKAYIRGLEAARKTVDQEMNLYYDLGIVNEMKGAYPEAAYYLKKIARKDPAYRDIRERLLVLEQAQNETAASSRRPVGEEDEFERVFDDLFGSK
jgi:tetratricopeptide (TPR) repeat protein